ncbi:MAG: hypothetical protein H7Y27_16830, partial [Gemmatimonadaceae bacterium]|nr:hypothetical protein [Chitinophagaceae bacterium]
MKQLIILAMLLTGIAGTNFAQDTRLSNSDKTFEPWPDFAKRRFFVDLGKGNKMQVELDAMEDIYRFSNLEAMVKDFLKDLEPFKDSLSDAVSAKKIDYVMDTTGSKKIRILRHAPDASSFSINNGDVSALKLEQDTIHFVGQVRFLAKYTLRKGFYATRYFRLSFFVNDINSLKELPDGLLNQKIANIAEHHKKGWSNHAGVMKMDADPSISAKIDHGYVAGGDYLTFKASADIQNYKNYFVPSISLGVGLTISSHGYFKREFTLAWEPNFFFSRDPQG